MGFAPRSGLSPPSIHVSTIVGSVVGGTVFLGSLASVAYWWFFRRRRSQSHCITTSPHACVNYRSRRAGSQSPTSSTNTRHALVEPSQGSNTSLADPYLPMLSVLHDNTQTPRDNLNPPEYQAHDIGTDRHGVWDGILSLYPASVGLHIRRPLPLPPLSPSSACEFNAQEPNTI